MFGIFGFPFVFRYYEFLYLYYEQVTLRRTWAKMPLWHKTKLVYSLLFQAVFLPKPDDLVKMVGSLHKILWDCSSLHKVIFFKNVLCLLMPNYFWWAVEGDG